MGGRGASSSRLAGLKVELDYAVTKRREYGSVKYGGTHETRERFDMWDKEVKRLQKALAKAEQRQAKSKKSNKEDDIPLF